MKVKNNFLYGSVLYIGLAPIFSIFFSIISLPIPSYLFVSLLTSLLIVYAIAEKGKIFAYKIYAILTFIAVFIIAYAFSFIMGRGSLASTEKIINILYVVILPIFLLTVAALSSNSSYKVDSVNLIYFRVFRFSTVALLIALFLFRIPESEGRYILPGLENPIWVSRHLASGLLVYFAYVYSLQKKMSSYQIIFVGVTFGALVISGSKAPIIAAIISLFFYFYGQRKLSVKVFFVSVISILFLMSILEMATTSYVFNTEFYSAYHRIDAISFVISQPFSFFGNGISSFGHYYFGEDVDLYPHNLLAELYFEIGVLGIFLFLVITWSIFKICAHSLPGLLALFYYINALSSGDIPGNSPLFLSLLVAWIVYKSDNKKMSKNRISIA